MFVAAAGDADEPVAAVEGVDGFEAGVDVFGPSESAAGEVLADDDDAEELRDGGSSGTPWCPVTVDVFRPMLPVSPQPPC